MRVAAFPAFSHRDVNPYTWLLYTSLEAAGQRILEFSWRQVLKLQVPDIFHVHWPEQHALAPSWTWHKLSRFVLFHFYLRFIRLRGGKVVWTAHNAFGHDQPRTRLNLFMWRSFFATIDGVIYLSAQSRRELEAAYPVLATRRSTVIQHGDFREWIAETRVAAPPAPISRASLGIPPMARVILTFGLIRPYKGIDLLIEEFKRLGGSHAHLVIAGYVSKAELERRIVGLSQNVSNIHCILRRVSDDELIRLLELCEIVVLPYREITNSGAAMLALSAGRPILVPNKGSLPELQQLIGDDWVRLYDGRISHSHLVEALAWAGAPRQQTSMKPFSWPDIAQQTLGFYRSLDRGD